MHIYMNFISTWLNLAKTYFSVQNWLSFIFLHIAAAAESLHSCLTLCNPIDGSPPGSPIPGILQARTLEWVVISFSNAWKWKVKVKSLSRVWLLVTPWTAAYQAPPSMGFSRQEYWRGVPLLSTPKSIYWISQLFLSNLKCYLYHILTFFIYLGLLIGLVTSSTDLSVYSSISQIMFYYEVYALLSSLFSSGNCLLKSWLNANNPEPPNN